MADLTRWRGLTALVADAVEHGASAIERIHLATARRPFAILERAPGIAAEVQTIHSVHDAIVSAVYGQVRFVTRLVGKTADAALEAFDEGSGAADGGGGEADRGNRSGRD